MEKRITEIYVGKKIRPKEEYRDWEDETSEVVLYSSKLGWEIISDNNFSGWYKTLEEVNKAFEEIE